MSCARDFHFRSLIPRYRGGSVTPAPQTDAAAPRAVIFGHMAGYARAVYGRENRRKDEPVFNSEELRLR